MDIESKIALIKQVGEEIITEEELRQLLKTKEHPIAYDGFEPSGNLHIAQGIMRAINVNKMLKAGCKFKMLVADWFGWLNNKLGGDLEKIKVVGKYQVEVWKSCGMETEKIEFLWTSDMVSDAEYWEKVVNVARATTIQRMVRCSQIMGRSEKEVLSSAQILYPAMQCADIFHLKADITQLGMDQRKVNILAREIGEKLGFWKPVVVSHHMLIKLQQPKPELPEINLLYNIIKKNPSPRKILYNHCEEYGFDLYELKRKIAINYPSLTNYLGLPDDPAQGPLIRNFDIIADAGLSDSNKTELYKKNLKNVENFRKQYFEERQMDLKMSKSKPDSAIFMNDSEDDIKRKIAKAYCPPKVIEENPMLEYSKYLIFEKFNIMGIKRHEKFGGDLVIENYAKLEKLYREGKIHPMDLKNAVAHYINEMIKPVREKFEKDAKLKKLVETIKGFEVTR